MSTTTMHFGPEWMRTKQHPTTKIHNPSSPPSTYSSLVSPILFEKRDDPNPFRYSKDEMLGIYKEGNVKIELALEVERWDGVVREVPSDPVGLREMDEVEKKLFSGSLNSDLRRRQSGDYLSPLSTSMDRSRLSYSNSNAHSPLRERFGALRRRDSADSPAGTSSLPRKHSVSSFQNPGISSRDIGQPSTRGRVGLASNFDGVLNNTGETWVTRRRASEASLKAAITISREVSGDFHNEARANEIQEETEEQDGGMAKSLDRILCEQQARVDGGTAQDLGLAEPEAHSTDIQANLSKMTIDYNKSNLGGTANGPPGLQDFASVEWSYKDPTGQIQGPFRADLMQKWYDEGYFSLDLPMKRTHLDSQWATVEDLIRRANGDKVFLSHRPPGLVRRKDSTLQPCAASAEHYMYPGLNQPSPIRTLRSSTLDNYVAIASNSSDSPSSFSGAQRSTGSPESYDPSARTSNHSYFGEQSMNGRTASLVSVAETSAPFPVRRATYGDALDHPGVAPSRTASLGNYPPSGLYNSGPHTQAFDAMSSRGVEPVPLSAYSQSPIIEQGLSYHNIRNGHDGVFLDGVFGSTAPSQLEFGSASRGQRPRGVNEDSSAYNQHNHFSAAINDARSTQSHFSQTGPTFVSHLNAQPPINTQIDSLNPSPSLQTVCVAPEALGRSPWQEADNVPVQRGEALDGLFRTETSATTISMTTPQVSLWSNKSDALHAQEISPWSYGEAVADLKSELQHDRLTFSNVVQHNQQYQSIDAQGPRPLALGSSNQQVDHLSLVPTSPSPVETPTIPSDLVQSSEVTTQPDQSRKATTPVTTVVPDMPEKVNATLPSKTAWAKDDDFRKLPSTISLREIQEAEAKKSEARKVAERPMKAVSSTLPELKDDAQPFTTSWGLPTSQVGTRPPAPQKEGSAAPSPSTSAPPQPVWTNTARTAATKKSMKEIQEEERRKKPAATKETTVATAVATTGRKPSAEPANKNPVNQVSAWTIVGANGRTAGPAGPASLKLPSASTSPGIPASSASRVDGPATAKSGAPVPAKSVTAKIIDDFPPAPSHDFLRWLTESLKGLNNSVNVEEILSMLLSFPLDPDPSTVELISDLIYTNSTTLDGRRFATEFVSKRKNDAASKAKTPGTSGKSVSKPVSIADVVKAAPKSAQSEWAFKIVNKKKKGGRT